MRYLPHTSEEIDRMLKALGLSKLEDLFKAIPPPLLEKEALKIPEAISEPELLEAMKKMEAQNGSTDRYALFLGAGAYSHYIPSHIWQLLLRSEFMTAYTPYQPEVSQGTLQAIFEFQTLICQLFGMEIANASMYDGASATAEAALMAMRIKQIPRILVAQSVHPQYRETLQTYTTHLGTELVEIGWDQSGAIDESELKAATKEPASALIVQYPNFFGVVEPLDRWAKIAHEANMLFVVAVTEATALGLLKPPGAFDADMVTGEGQAFGIPLSFGGPYLGLFASKKSFVRQMPGRLVGETVDREGRRAFVVTLATREQHIRRAKATSNICTNQGLFALAATIYLSTLGKNGLRDLASLNLQRACAFRRELERLPGIEFPFSGSTFNEFVIRIDRDTNLLLQRLLEKKIIGGLDLGRFYPQFENHLLVTVTETTPKEAWKSWKETYLEGARHA